MALSLGLKSDSKWVIGGDPVSVRSIGPGNRAVLGVGAKSYPITDVARVEILPQVFCCLGPTDHHRQGLRVVFEAPREIGIRRV